MEAINDPNQTSEIKIHWMGLMTINNAKKNINKLGDTAIETTQSEA